MKPRQPVCWEVCESNATHSTRKNMVPNSEDDGPVDEGWCVDVQHLASHQEAIFL